MGTISTTRGVEIGDQDEQELAQAIHEAIRRTAKRLSNRLKKSFCDMLLEYKAIFSIRLGARSTDDVPPTEIKFEGMKHPVEVRQRTYSPEQLDFMKKKCDELLMVGFIYRNPSSEWAYNPVIVPKDGPEGSGQFPIQEVCVADASRGPMLAKMTRASSFFQLDFIRG